MDKKPAVKYFFGETLRMAAGGVMLFWAAGRIDWWPGWAAVATMAAMIIAIGLVGIRLNPDLLLERTGVRKGDKPWDVVIYYAIRLVGGGGGCFIIAGLDLRYGWTSGFPVILQIAGGVVLFLGCALFVWATAANMFFAIMVRIQQGQTVATGGPYRFVRHPGYVGAMATQLAYSMLLASWWSIIPSLLGVVAYIIRTAIEDRTLQEKLPGYTNFAQQVRYRLLPGIW